MRRDDPSPAPWTKAGKKRSAELGLEMQVSVAIRSTPSRGEMQVSVAIRSTPSRGEMQVSVAIRSTPSRGMKRNDPSPAQGPRAA